MAHNTTGTKKDGTSEYDVEARINENLIFKAHVEGHFRSNGAAALLRKIADVWDTRETG